MDDPVFIALPTGIEADLCAEIAARQGRPRDLSRQGVRFHHLVPQKAIRRRGKPAWECLCDCGRLHVVMNEQLGKIKSCGQCGISKEASKRTTHGMTNTPTWNTWSGMLARCTNPSNKDYKRYGARGISVCDRWKVFEYFLMDMGERPAGTTIDRIDNLGNYEPGNCRWATVKEQNNNRRSNRVLTTERGELTMSQAAKLSGKSCEVLAYRIDKMGMTADEAMNLPFIRNRKKVGA